MGINKTGSLSYLAEEDLPSASATVQVEHKESKVDFPYFKQPVFRRILLEIVDACDVLQEENRHLTTTSKPAHIKALARMKRSGANANTVTEVITEAAAKTPKIPNVKIDPYDNSDLETWIKKTEKEFGSAGADTFINDSDYCAANDEISYALVCKLVKALTDSRLAFISSKHDKERNCTKFWELIKDQRNEAHEKMWKQLAQWSTIYGLSLSGIEEWDDYYNKFSIALSKLEEESSIAIKDTILLQALVMKHVSGEDFKTPKEELSKKVFGSAREILETLKTHADILQNSSRYESGGASQAKTAKARRSKSSSGCSEFAFDMPKFPTNLKEWMYPGGYEQMLTWRSKAFTANSKEARDSVNKFTIRGPRSKSEQPREDSEP